MLIESLRWRQREPSIHEENSPPQAARVAVNRPSSWRIASSLKPASPNVIEIKLDRLIDDMRLLRSQMIAFDKRLKGIEAYLKPSEQQPESKSRPWFPAAASATAGTVLILFAVGAATGAALLYLGT